MLTNKQILEESGLLIVEKDNKGNIIQPIDDKTLKEYTSIINDTIYVDNQRYNPTTDKWYEIQEKEIYDQKNKEYHKVTYITDITSHKKRELKAQIDYVTKVNNRTLTNCLTNAYIKKAKETNESFAVIIADLDSFKEINDLYGHHCGDKVLRKIAKIIYSTTRHNKNSDRELDIVGRFGGDEFYYLLSNISKKDAIKKAEFHKQQVENAYITFEGKKTKLPTMSIGLYYIKSEYLDDITDIDDFRSEIFRKADKALYHSKNQGKNKVIDYSSINR